MIFHQHQVRGVICATCVNWEFVMNLIAIGTCSILHCGDLKISKASLLQLLDLRWIVGQGSKESITLGRIELSSNNLCGCRIHFTVGYSLGLHATKLNVVSVSSTYEIIDTLARGCSSARRLRIEERINVELRARLRDGRGLKGFVLVQAPCPAPSLMPCHTGLKRKQAATSGRDCGLVVPVPASDCWSFNSPFGLSSVWHTQNAS